MKLLHRLRKFFRLPAHDRRLLANAALLLGGIKLGLMLLPFQTVRRLLRELTRLFPHPSGGERRLAEKVVWAVEKAGVLSPWARTCLTQALAVQVLLLRRKQPARLHIGAARGERGEFLAHAWVESGGEVVIGGYELDRYTRLAVLEEEADAPVRV